MKLNKKEILCYSVIMLTTCLLCNTNLNRMIMMGFLMCLCWKIAREDIKTYTIENENIIAAIIIWIIYLIGEIFGCKGVNCVVANMKMGLTSSIYIGGGLLILTLLMEKITNKEMFGGGDIKLIGVLALFFNIVENALAIAIGCIASLLYILIIKRRNKKELPFAPFIFIGYYAIIILEAFL